MELGKVIIVGGGIGGLTLAIALQHAKIPFEVFERAPELKEVGAGFGLWANAVKVLDRLGVGARLREIGMPLHVGEMCSDKGRTLSRANLSEAASATDGDAGCYTLHRAELHAALAEQLPPSVIKTNHECIGVEETDADVKVHFANGTKAEGTLLVGADGLKSVVRAHLWGREKPRYSGQTCFRGVVDFETSDRHVVREVHGAGKRFGICPMSKNRTYWFAAFNAPEGEMIDFDKRQEILLKEFKDWRWQVPELIAATPSETILQNDLVDRVPIKRWSKGAITLLGDAAHPTTPNLGQGACMAIEDAMVMARSLMKHANLSDALQSYEQARNKRTASIVRQSRSFGKLANWKHPFAVWMRELLVQATPQFLIQQAIRSQSSFDAGDLS